MASSLTFNLADLFESVADAVPERPAVVTKQRQLSFRELDERATRLANCWKALGIGPGDHIGLQLYNGSEYLEGMLAAYKLRAVPININYHYVAAELQYLYTDADLVAVVTHQAFAPAVAQVAGDVEKLRYIFSVADDSGAAVDPAFRDYEEALANSSDLRNFEPRDSDDIYIVYTGGTTGMPKGVMWHHRDIFFGAMGGGDLATVEEDGRILLLGRGSFSINSGGEKIFPEEVESVVKEYPDVIDAVVVGLEDERFGERVVAVCQTRSGSPVELEKLREFCRGKLASYKIPRSVVCLKKTKRSPAGKADYPWAREAARKAA
jgi:acyl-CoA synthetase (AMP-forming)/AMP-acid ligase II